MNIHEISEDLEQQFGRPRNVTAENIRFMISLVKEQSDGKEVDEAVEQPSLDALGTTILAVMSYQMTPWEELAQRPSIRKTLKFVAVRGESHYDEIEAMTKELMRKHFKGLTQKMILGFLRIIRALSEEEHPSKLIEYTPYPAQYNAISHGLHQLIRAEHPEEAAIIIHFAIEDGILMATVPRSVITNEFNLSKSGFDKYFKKYHLDMEQENERVKKDIDKRIRYYRTSLKATIGYVVETDDTVRFLDRRMGRKNFLSIIVAYCRSIFRG